MGRREMDKWMNMGEMNIKMDKRKTAVLMNMW